MGSSLLPGALPAGAPARRRAGHPLAVQPQLVVGTGARLQMLGQGLGHRLYLPVQGGVLVQRRAQHVAVHVAAGGDGGQQHVVDAADRILQVPLQHAVELKRLPGGHPDGALAMIAGQLVELQPLLGRDDAAGDPGTHHETVSRLQLLPGPLRADVAVVLQIGAMELGEAGVVFRDGAGQRVGQPLGDGAPQIIAVPLDDFHVGNVGVLVSVTHVGRRPCQ